MCGLTAFFDVHDNTTKPDDTEFRAKRSTQLERSAQSMHYRGSDGQRVWLSSNATAGLGHVRRATRDMSPAGSQPLHSSTIGDDIHIVVNGELYYEPSVRKDLEREYTFNSRSDSEMVIPLYKRYGVNFVEKLRGEFAFVLYDENKRLVIAGRDIYGVKLLHYCFVDGRLLIASQCKSVLALKDDENKVTWDLRCLAQGSTHHGNRTFFEGVQKFPAGHLLVAQLADQGRNNGSKELSITPYQHTLYPPNTKDGLANMHDTTAIKGLRSRILEAVQLRLFSSDVPVGILLSGGIDSSAIAGMATFLAKQRALRDGATPVLPVCFTLSFPDDADLDESLTAERTARNLGLQLEKVVITEQLLVEHFDQACWRGEVILFDLQHIAKKILSQHISQRGVRVVLSGDGSDELFGGYPFFVADRLKADDLRRDDDISTEKLKSQSENHAKTLAWFSVEEELAHQENKYARALGLTPAFCKFAIPRWDDGLKEEVRQLSDPFEAIFESLSPTEIAAIQNCHPLHKSLLIWNKTLLSNMFIAAVADGAEMAHGVESRPPFLDSHVSEFSSKLPVSMLIKCGADSSQVPTEKWILREAVRPFVTDEVYKKRKQALAAPYRWKQGGPMYFKLKSQITRANVERLGFADWATCENMVEQSFARQDGTLFRKAGWLAQLISIGQQFDVQLAQCHGD